MNVFSFLGSHHPEDAPLCACDRECVNIRMCCCLRFSVQLKLCAEPTVVNNNNNNNNTNTTTTTNNNNNVVTNVNRDTNKKPLLQPQALLPLHPSSLPPGTTLPVQQDAEE